MTWQWMAAMPSTNVRIAASIVMALATCTKMLLNGWSPSIEWLAFLCVWAGLDVAQFASKRITQHTGASAPSEG